jgi:uncharacterized DUF497 family protein
LPEPLAFEWDPRKAALNLISARKATPRELRSYEEGED